MNASCGVVAGHQEGLWKSPVLWLIIENHGAICIRPCGRRLPVIRALLALSASDASASDFVLICEHLVIWAHVAEELVFESVRISEQTKAP